MEGTITNKKYLLESKLTDYLNYLTEQSLSLINQYGNFNRLEQELINLLDIAIHEGQHLRDLINETL